MQGKDKLRFIFSILLAVVLMGAAPAAAKTVTLRWAHYVPDHPIFVAADSHFAKRVEEITGGEVKVQIFYGETLGKVKEMLGLVKNGTVDMASFPTGYFTSAFPLWSAPNNLPFTMSDLDQAYRTAVDLPSKLEGVQEEIKKQNLRLLFHHVLSPYQVFSTKPLTKFEDWKGIKVRTWGAYMPDAFAAAGAVAVNVFPAEVYESLKRGVVDAAIWPLELGLIQKHYEVAPNVCLWNLGTFIGWGNWINLNSWNKLTPEQQKAFTDAAVESRKVELDSRAKMDIEAREKLIALKARIIEIDPAERQKWIDASPNFLDQWVSEMKDKGLGKDADELKAQWQKVIGQAK